MSLAVGRVVNLWRAAQPVNWQAAPTARLASASASGSGRDWVGCDAGNLKLLEQGLDLRCEPGRMARLTDDATRDPASQFTQKTVSNTDLEAQARRQLNE